MAATWAGSQSVGLRVNSLNAFGEAQSSIAAKWVARRGADGWSAASLNPLAGGRVPSAYDEPVVMASASDLSRILIGSATRSTRRQQRNLCAKRAKTRAIVRFSGQNGKIRAFKPKLRNGCHGGRHKLHRGRHR